MQKVKQRIEHAKCTICITFPGAFRIRSWLPRGQRQNRANVAQVEVGSRLRTPEYIKAEVSGGCKAANRYHGSETLYG